MKKKRIVLILACLLCRYLLTAQINMDTLPLRLSEAERMFLDSNLQLLAQRYNVDAQQALIIQAKLWSNPNFSYGHGPVWPVHDPVEATFTNNSSNSASLSQLILLAGKRNKQVRLAQANARLSEFQFYDLLRTLKYALRIDFFNIYFLQQSAKVYDEEINALKLVVKAFAEQQGKGYISEKEVIRIRAQLYNLQSEYSDLLTEIYKTESELRLVLQAKPGQYIDPKLDSAALDNLQPDKFALHVLIDSAYHNRTDLQIAKANLTVNQLNYKYQKALAVPDLSLAFSYDQQGSYVHNFQTLGASVDLPFFNRNQGNIKSARAMIDFGDANVKSTAAIVEENVTNSLQKAFTQDKLFHSIDRAFSIDFDRLMREVLNNYQKRNISLLDFLDFYNSYKQNILQLNSIQFNRISAFEDLNYYTGTNFFN